MPKAQGPPERLYRCRCHYVLCPWWCPPTGLHCHGMPAYQRRACLEASQEGTIITCPCATQVCLVCILLFVVVEVHTFLAIFVPISHEFCTSFAQCTIMGMWSTCMQASSLHAFRTNFSRIQATFAQFPQESFNCCTALPRFFEGEKHFKPITQDHPNTCRVEHADCSGTPTGSKSGPHRRS